MRLFLAIDLPAEVRNTLSRAVAALQRQLPPARWARVEGIHLTLVFLGETDERLLGGLDTALTPVFAEVPAFDLALHGAGCFPPGGAARVAWVGVESTGDLGALAKRCALAVSEVTGKPPEERAFHAHLTLARCDPRWPRAAAERFVTAATPLASGAFGASEGVLFESQLRPQGALYTPLRRYPLRGAQ